MTLTTDFGLRDGYVAAMKGVVLGLCPNVVLVDVTHEIPPQDVRRGAFILGAAARRFPPGTIHLGVVDPGVGTERRGMVLVSGGHVYVGPDNGLFTFAAVEDARAVRIDPTPSASATFHGRDLFAPTAARIAAGVDPLTLGPLIEEPVRLPDWEKTRERGRVIGRILHVDRFGNCVTNIETADFPIHPDRFEVPGRAVPRDLPIGRTYGDAAAGCALWLVGSDGFYELAIREGDAAASFDVRVGDAVAGVVDREGA